jgi:hypothetical protein
MTSPHDRERASAASAALADIERQQLFITGRLSEFARLPSVVAVVLALAAASLAYRNIVLFVVVQVIYMAALVPLVGAPLRSGVIPRESRQGLRLVFVLCVVLLSVPQLAMLGPWWTAIVAGAGAGVAVVVLSRWRLAATLREARRPALVEADQQHVVSDRIATVPTAIVIAVMCAGTLACASPDRVLTSMGVLAYFLGAVSLFVRRRPEGLPLPTELRPGLVVKALLLGFALVIPVTLTMFFTSLRGNWWVASCCAVATALTVTAIRRWQHDILRQQARAASPPPLDGANG